MTVNTNPGSLKILLVTDLEAVAGVVSSEDWCVPEGRHYPLAKRLLTLEVNAAVDGFFAGGATYVQVADAHGKGGIDIELLDERVEYARGWSPEQEYIFNLDSSYAGVAWVGQHAKASTQRAHLAHTQNMYYLDQRTNGLSVGEIGQTALCAGELGVPSFFLAGDLAATEELRDLVPDAVCVAVKRGVIAGTGESCSLSEYRSRNWPAVHLSPGAARTQIRTRAEEAMKLLVTNPPAPLKLDPPYERITRFRPAERGGQTTESRERHESSIIELFNQPFSPVPES